jgi:hypothetical protein
VVKQEGKMSTLRFENAIVTNMVEEALEFCAEKAGLKDKEHARSVLLTGNCRACEYMRHALAQKMAAYLGSVDDTIRAIYTYEPEHGTHGDEALPGRPNLSPGLNLIARVSRKSAALSSVVASLRLALAEEHSRLGCPKANALCSELDVRVVDEDEVQKRIGHGALISSFHVRPIEVWHR